MKKILLFLLLWPSIALCGQSADMFFTVGNGAGPWNVGLVPEGNGSNVTNGNPGEAYAIKVSGTPAHNGTLNSITIGAKAGSPRAFSLSLYTDIAGVPGTFVASSTGSGTVTGSTFAAYTVTTGAASIVAGTQYWIVTQMSYAILDFISSSKTLYYMPSLTPPAAWNTGSGWTVGSTDISPAYFTYH